MRKKRGMMYKIASVRGTQLVPNAISIIPMAQHRPRANNNKVVHRKFVSTLGTSFQNMNGLENNDQVAGFTLKLEIQRRNNWKYMLRH